MRPVIRCRSHRVRRLARWCPGFLVLGILTLAALAGPNADAPSRADVGRWVRELGDARFRVRELASERLWKAGHAAESALRRAQNSDDPEVAWRSRAILEKFRYGLYPDTPARFAALVDRYRSGDFTQQGQALQGLYDAGPPGRAVLRKLAWATEDTELNRRLFEPVASQSVHHAELLSPTAGQAEVGEFLETGVACMAEPALRAYAAYHLLRGSLDGAIASLRERADDGDRRADEALVHLYRARGDLLAARQAAERSGRAMLLEGILAEQGDWKALAEAVARRAERIGGRTEAPPSPGLRAFCDRLAGNSARAETETRQAASEIARTGSPALFFLGRPRQALASLTRDGHDADAFEFLAFQSKYREALALADGVRIPDSACRWALDALTRARPYVAAITFLTYEKQCHEAVAYLESTWLLRRQERRTLELNLAETMHQLGRTDEALALFASLGGDTGPTSRPWPALIEAEVQLGLRELADRHAARLLAGGPGSAAGVLALLFPQPKGAADVWWLFLRRKSHGEPPLVTLRHLRRLLEAPEASAEFAALAPELEKEALVNPADQETWLRALGETALARGQAEMARRYFAKGGQAPVAASLSLLRLGDLLASQKRWAEAADAYGRAWDRDRNRPIPLHLRGWALCQTGRAKEGKELMARARWLPLGNEEVRYDFAEALAEHGLTEAARDEHELILRTGAYDRASLANVQNHRAAEAAARKDFLAAAEHGNRVLLAVLQTGLGFVRPRSCLSLPALVHRHRARGLVDHGRIEEARAEIRQALDLLPGDVDLPILLVPALERRGHQVDADILFNRVHDFHARLCAEYPRSPTCHNTLAWLLARCRHQLDEARMHACQAVGLSPDRAGLLDTLAEVEFQSGRRDEAIKAMRRCLVMEPRNAYFQKQLKRFETGDRDAAVPDE